MKDFEDHEDSEAPTENSLKWLESEMANHAGFTVTLKTYEHDYICGRICGVRSGGVLLVDENKNRIYCDLGIIALYCIMNPKAKSNKPKGEEKIPKKTKKKKPQPKAGKLPMRRADEEAAQKKRKRKKGE